MSQGRTPLVGVEWWSSGAAVVGISTSSTLLHGSISVRGTDPIGGVRAAVQRRGGLSNAHGDMV